MSEELLQQIAEGGPFDTTEAIRAIARKLAAGAPTTKVVPEATTAEQPKKKRAGVDPTAQEPEPTL